MTGVRLCRRREEHPRALAERSRGQASQAPTASQDAGKERPDGAREVSKHVKKKCRLDAVASSARQRHRIFSCPDSDWLQSCSTSAHTHSSSLPVIIHSPAP